MHLTAGRIGAFHQTESPISSASHHPDGTSHDVLTLLLLLLLNADAPTTTTTNATTTTTTTTATTYINVSLLQDLHPNTVSRTHR